MAEPLDPQLPDRPSPDGVTGREPALWRPFHDVVRGQVEQVFDEQEQERHGGEQVAILERTRVEVIVRALEILRHERWEAMGQLDGLDRYILCRKCSRWGNSNNAGEIKDYTLDVAPPAEIIRIHYRMPWVIDRWLLVAQCRRCGQVYWADGGSSDHFIGRARERQADGRRDPFAEG